MEQPSSSSKVTVEYFDPYGVFPLISPGLLPRIPLRNLHWESHSGPLRSIISLHIDLVSSADPLTTHSTLDTPTTRPDLTRLKSDDSVVGSDDGFRTQSLGQAVGDKTDPQSEYPKSANKSRRHQIPGLRQTPYLKIFLLRCDDNDSYKASARREVREWIKEHTPSSQSTAKLNAQENHDAYEWLIVHVIVPNTAAATQPRSSSRADSSLGSSSDKTGAARWRGGGSSTILDKLRADFNSSSKSATDRVAQIRIGVNDVPYEMLPRVVPAIPGSYSETPEENENAWLDLIIKFKELILSSFDMRVSQYEEDIRERDAQRTLPGWNFCTFFVLKEGLARGFESVGLVEDALVGYDELAVGLDAIVREQSLAGSGPEHGGSFLPYTEDLKVLVESARASLLKDMGLESDAIEAENPIDLQAPDSVADEIPLDASRKRYRELILANNISIFDFRCYLFARQLSLLLRRANAWSSQEELLAKLKEQRESSLQGVATRFPTFSQTGDPENLTVLGEVCQRSMDFVSSISSIIRDDVWASQGHSLEANDNETREIPSQKDPVMVQIIDNIVSSLTFSIAQQILAQTSTKSLPIPPSTLAPPSSKIGMDDQEQKAAIPEPKTMMHPARSSSLALRSRSREPSSPRLLPSGRRRSSVPDRDRGSVTSTFLKAGLEELAAQRAGLYLLSRNILEKIGQSCSWSVGWAEVAKLQYGNTADMYDIDLSYGAKDNKSDTSLSSIKLSPTLHGIESKLLRVALENQDDFYRLYETLTDKALRHYTVAGHGQSADATMADLAVLKFHLKDYAAAASYFYQITPSYNENGWTQIELSMLVMYAESLKQLQRKEEYVRIVLKLLYKAAMAENERLQAKSSFQLGPNYSSHEEVVPREPYLKELLQITKSLQHNVQVPLQNFFGQIEIEGTPQYHTDKDSFSLQIRLRYLLSETFTIDKAKVKLTTVASDASKEIWLETDSPIICKHGNVKFQVHSNTLIPATYLVTHVSLHSSNIILKYDHGTVSPTFGRNNQFFKCPKLLIYQQADAFDIKLYASKYMHLARNRSLEIELSSGWNEVVSGKLHVRPATAGLRLQTSETKVVSGSVNLLKTSEVSIVRFGAMSKGTRAKLRVPFNLEHDNDDISLKLELSYTTDKGEFFFSTSPRMSIMLPLGVNVQDVFKHKALFSRFTITSATTSPLRLLSSNLENSEFFQAESGVGLMRPVVVYPRQPASMLYKITKSPLQTVSSPRTPSKVKSALALTLHYVCLEEEIESAVTQTLEQRFQDTPLRPFIRLVVSTVLSELQAHLSPYDLERIAVLSEVSTAPLSNIEWKDHFNGLGRSTYEDEDTSTILSNKLQEWQQENPRIPLISITLNDATIENSRSIIIPVEVPSINAVHTADIKLLGQSSHSGAVPHNQPIPASLTIKWTKNWDTEAQHGTLALPRTDNTEYVYEISAPTDMWLIGGRRKGHFKIQPELQESRGALSFPIVLIPLREGFLPYPSLEIRPAPVTKVIQSRSPRSPVEASLVQEVVPTCETDYKNAGETIRVISDARKTTVSLDASGPQGGAMLLESERRSGGNGELVLG